MIELKDVSFTYESGETENNLSHINLRQHRTENCVQKMSLRGKIKT